MSTARYITLFASAYPLASCIGVVANLVEVRSDGLKLARVHRKPHALRKGTIGTWLSLMMGIVALSALTNVYIFGFTSRQLMQCVAVLVVAVVLLPTAAR